MDKEFKERVKLAKAKRKGQRKLFRKRIDALFKTENRYSLRFEEAHVFDDGKAYINIDLTQEASPFSKYSYDTRINQEIYDYINQETWFIPADIPVVINLDDDGKYADEMKTKIKKAIIRHYSLEYEDKRHALHQSRKFGFFSLIVGLIILSVYIALSITFASLFSNNDANKYQFFLEILNIFSWVFIWEAVDRFALTGFDETVDVLNAGQLALIEVQFGKPMEKINKQ